MVLWFTGQPGSGKTTLTKKIHRRQINWIYESPST